MGEGQIGIFRKACGGQNTEEQNKTGQSSSLKKDTQTGGGQAGRRDPLSKEDVLKSGGEFLQQNSKKDGVKATPSGLQYKILKKGKGGKPGPASVVTVHYRGTLTDGSEFDSSYKREKPISFALNQVIKGWTEGLQLMREGAVYQFFIPPELGYGAHAMPKIPAHSVLIFKVELISIQQKP